jgi:hypothetical protein
MAGITLDLNLSREMATKMRKYYVEKGSIQENMTFLEKKTIEKMLSSVGDAMASVRGDEKYKNIKGELKKFIEGETPLGVTEDGKREKKEKHFIEKTDNFHFVIYFEPDEFDHINDNFPYMQALHEIGHVVMHWDDMNLSEKLEEGPMRGKVRNRLYCSDPGAVHRQAQTFAREFAMPENIYKKVFRESSNKNKKFDSAHFAKTYKLYCPEAKVRGIELGLIS